MKTIRIIIDCDIDLDEFPESKLTGNLTDQIGDHTRNFVDEILGGKNIEIEIKNDNS